MKVEPSYGGSTKMVNRLGDRFAYEVTFKGRSEQAAPVVAKLNQAARDKARIPVNQSVVYDQLGPVTVGIATSGGTTLNLRGTGKLSAGQFINLTANSKNYLHMVTADSILTAAGVAVQVTPPVRTSISVGSAVEVNAPVIEGYLSSTSTEWTVKLLPRVTEFTFTVVEAE